MNSVSLRNKVHISQILTPKTTSAQAPQNNATLYAYTRSFKWQCSRVIQPHVSFLQRLPQQLAKSGRPARRSVPQEHSTEKCVGTQVGRQCWLLPALPMWQRVLLLTCDEGGAPHRAAVTVSEPAHRGWRWVRGAAEAMVWLSLCSERRGWAPHHHNDRKLVSESSLIGGSVCFGVFFESKKVDKGSTVLFSETYWDTLIGKRLKGLFGPQQQPLCVCLL